METLKNIFGKAIKQIIFFSKLHTFDTNIKMIELFNYLFFKAPVVLKTLWAVFSVCHTFWWDADLLIISHFLKKVNFHHVAVVDGTTSPLWLVILFDRSTISKWELISQLN